jgi:uncharacterized protein YbcV (DUF1398 family)
MFSVEDVQAAHSKVKSGADFPAYVQELIELGVKKYDVFVQDGHAVYFGSDGFQTSSEAKYTAMEVAPRSEAATFRLRLKIHQQGATDYTTFCRDAAEAGIEKWRVDLEKMTCIYFNKADKEVVVESIPTR